MAAAAKKLILLIDDDKTVLDTISHLLERLGHMVCAFQNAKDAIQETMLEDFDLIISDIRMPKIDGIQAIRYIREIRQQQGKSQIPEILITGYAEDYAEEMTKLKPHAIIHKPFDLDEFIKVISSKIEDAR